MWNFTFDREKDRPLLPGALPGLDNIEYARSKAGQFRPYHTHAECHVIFCIGGKGFLKVGDQELELVPGMLAVIRPDVPHSCGSSEGWFEFWGLSFYSAGPDDRLSSDIISSEYYAAGFGAYIDYVKGAFSYLRELCGKDGKDHAHAEDAYAQVCSLLFFTRRMLLCHPIVKETPGDLPMQDILEWIGEHYSEDIVLDTLSRRFAVSASHLSRRFLSAYGISPINYLIDVRLNAAKDLLFFTDLPISEIAAKVGYANMYHFGNLFKKRIGLTPHEFRIMCRKNAPDSAPESDPPRQD